MKCCEEAYNNVRAVRVESSLVRRGRKPMREYICVLIEHGAGLFELGVYAD
ncbi:MAG: hypothetical protein WC560_02805 [Syntrophales bacterium]